MQAARPRSRPACVMAPPVLVGSRRLRRVPSDPRILPCMLLRPRPAPRIDARVPRACTVRIVPMLGTRQRMGGQRCSTARSCKQLICLYHVLPVFGSVWSSAGQFHSPSHSKITMRESMMGDSRKLAYTELLQLLGT